MWCQDAGAWTGLLASAAGIASALFFARASSRTLEDEAARNALLLLDNVFVEGKDNTPAGTARPKPTAQSIKDLTDDILRKNEANRRDMRRGARLLLLAFGLLVMQSLTMFCAAK